MDFDNSWHALLRPGEATEFFESDPLPRFDIHAPAFCVAVAWWLAELSRLAYRQVAASPQSVSQAVSRQRILARVHLDEVRFLGQGGTQCALIASKAPSHDPFGVLVFRGTSELGNWRDNLNARLVPHQSGRAHRGFLHALDVVWDEISNAMRDVEGPLFFTGHSLGAALATLAASRWAPRAVYTFGSPRVADGDLARALERTRVYRVVNGADLVTRVPPKVGERCFRHVGEVHYLARDGRDLVDPSAREIATDRATHRRVRVWPPWKRPPAFLSDHAPVNYVAHIQRQLHEQEHEGE